MKKMLIIILAMVSLIMVGGCASVERAQKFQNLYFDKDGNRAGGGVDLRCLKQALKKNGQSILGFCDTPNCNELREACMVEAGYTTGESRAFATTEERMALYKQAYEEGWIKPGMGPKEVLSILGSPQAFAAIKTSKYTWIYCRSATKTALIGFNFTFNITFLNGRVVGVVREFRM